MRDVADFPALLQSFFITRLMTQRRVSPHTIASYRDRFRLLLQFAQKADTQSALPVEPGRPQCVLDWNISGRSGDPAWQVNLLKDGIEQALQAIIE